MKERFKKGKAGGGWEKEREKFFEERGVGIEEIERGREEGSMCYGDVEKKDKVLQRKERRNKIRESRFNKWYKMGEGVPEYLKKGWGESRWRRVIRFRLEMK